MSETAHIGDGVRHLDRAMLSRFGEAQDEVAEIIADAWRGRVARRSGRFHRSIGVRAARLTTGERERMVDAPDAKQYSDVYERGWRERGRGQASYPGRFAAKRAIEESAAEISFALDEAGADMRREVNG